MKQTERKIRKPTEQGPPSSSAESGSSTPALVIDGDRLPCPFCSASYQHRPSLRRHVGAMHGSDLDGKPLSVEQILAFQRSSSKAKKPEKRSRPASPEPATTQSTKSKTAEKKPRKKPSKPKSDNLLEPFNLPLGKPTTTSFDLPLINIDLVNDLVVSSDSELEDTMIVKPPSDAPATVSKPPESDSSRGSTPLIDEILSMPSSVIEEVSTVEKQSTRVYGCLAVGTRSTGVTTRSRSASPAKAEQPSIAEAANRAPPSKRRHREIATSDSAKPDDRAASQKDQPEPTTAVEEPKPRAAGSATAKGSRLPKPKEQVVMSTKTPSITAPQKDTTVSSVKPLKEKAVEKKRPPTTGAVEAVVPLTVVIPGKTGPDRTLQPSSFHSSKPRAEFDPFLCKPTKPSPVITPSVRPALSLNDLTTPRSVAPSATRMSGAVLFQAIKENPTESVEQIGARLAMQYRWNPEERRQNVLRLQDFREAVDMAAFELKVNTPTNRDSKEEMDELFGYIQRVVSVAKLHRP